MGNFADVVMAVGRTRPGADQKIANIIEFVEAPWGLNPPTEDGSPSIRLYPVQKVILKAHYGIPLDDVETFQVSDWRREKFTTFTEKTYLEFLFDTGRCNIREIVPGQERRELVLAIGRRSGKTFLASCIAAYETYKLLLKGSPQAYYGLPVGNTIQIVSVATDRDQAGLLYKEVSSHFRTCTFFSPYTANNTQTYARFQTPADIERYGRYQEDPTAKATLNVTFKSCIAKGLRGAGNIVIILDEMAHFTDGGQSSADEVYKAVTPSAATFSFKDTKTRASIGDSEGRIISISSPLGRQGKFYELFTLGFASGKAAARMLCIQAPTWEVNPTVGADVLEKNFIKDATSFYTEFGAEFTDRTKGWIERAEDLQACIDPNLRPRVQGLPRQPHFIGIDIGLVGDGSAIAIGHIENNQIVVDLVDQIKAGEGEHKDEERLDFEGVADWVYLLSRRFYLAEGLFDHWAGIPFEQALHRRGLKQLKVEQMTRQLKSEIFKNFKDMMWDGRLRLYDHPIDEGKAHCPYVTELLELQAEMHSKYIIDVQAPQVEGKHDDRSDALVRMVWMASQKMGKAMTVTRGTVSSVNGPMFGAQTSRLNLARAMRNARRMGSSPDRQSNRLNRFRTKGR
jgi:hypothetical protein